VAPTVASKAGPAVRGRVGQRYKGVRPDGDGPARPAPRAVVRAGMDELAGGVEISRRCRGSGRCWGACAALRRTLRVAGQDGGVVSAVTERSPEGVADAVAVIAPSAAPVVRDVK